MYSLAAHLVQPYLLAYLITGVAVISLWRKREATRKKLLVLTFGVGLMGLVSIQAVSFLAHGSLEWAYPPLRLLPQDAEAIVVLAGSYALPNSVDVDTLLGSDTIQRCISAADAYRRRKPILVVVSGPNTEVTRRAASPTELMRDLLVKLGVDERDVKLEPNSRSTYENAVESRKMLERLGIRKVMLVTEAWHMRRALLSFRKQGIEVVPIPCNHQATDFEWSILSFLPSPNSADGICDVIHEWIGLAWYRLRGWT